MTILEITKHYKDYLNTSNSLSPASIKGYIFDIQTFTRYLDIKQLSDIQSSIFTRKYIKDYFEWLHIKYANKSIKRLLSTIKNMFYFAFDYELIDVNPMCGLRLKVHKNKKPTVVMETKEINKFLYTLHNVNPYSNSSNYGKFTRERDIAMIELLFSTGIRVAELANLKYDNWDKIDNSFTFIAKGNKHRKIFIDNHEVLEALTNYTKIAYIYNQEYIFINKKYIKISTSAIRDVVKKYTKLAGIDKNITPHVFRRTYGTLLIENGMDITYVKEALGHSNITSTQIYIRLSDQSVRKKLQGYNPRDAMSF